MPLPGREEVLGRRGHWLVELEVGRTHRFSDEDVIVTDSDSVSYEYREGLGPIDAPFALPPGSSSNISITIRTNEDWAQWVARGHTLARSKVVLRRWYEGQSLERARVVIRGIVDAPSYDRAGAELSFSIVRRPSDLSDPIIGPLRRIQDGETWPVSGGNFQVDEKVEGVAYPLMVGYPGLLPDGTTVPAVPCPVAEVDPVAGGEMYAMISMGDVEATQGTLWDLTTVDDLSSSFSGSTVSQQDDARGINTALCHHSSVATSVEHLDLYFGCESGHGGLLRRDRTAPVRGAGELILRLLRDYTRVDVDSSRMDTDALNNFKIDTWMNEPTNAWEWLRTEILSLLPIVEVEGPNGWYVTLPDWTATEVDCVARLDASRTDVVRVPGVTIAGASDVKNEFALDYCPMADSGDYLRTAVLTGQFEELSGQEIGESTDVRIRPSRICRASQDQYGVEQSQESTYVVWDDSTAFLILLGRARTRALPKRQVAYVGPRWLESIDLWSPILLTDPEVYFEDAVALVADIEPLSDATRVELVLTDHPAHIIRETT